MDFKVIKSCIQDAPPLLGGEQRHSFTRTIEEKVTEFYLRVSVETKEIHSCRGPTEVITRVNGQKVHEAYLSGRVSLFDDHIGFQDILSLDFLKEKDLVVAKERMDAIHRFLVEQNIHECMMERLGIKGDRYDNYLLKSISKDLEKLQRELPPSFSLNEYLNRLPTYNIKEKIMGVFFTVKKDASTQTVVLEENLTRRHLASVELGVVNSADRPIYEAHQEFFKNRKNPVFR